MPTATCKWILGFIAVLVTLHVQAGSIQISPKTILNSGEKQLTIPVISGLEDTVIQSSINSKLTLESNEFSSEDESLINANFQVIFQNNTILDIQLIYETLTAYPETHLTEKVFILKTGQQLLGSALFQQEQIPLVLKTLIQLKAKADNEALKAQKRNSESYLILKNALRSHSRLRITDFDQFSITEKGLLFHYDHAFPHAIKAVEPDSNYLLTRTQLRSWLKQDIWTVLFDSR